MIDVGVITGSGIYELPGGREPRVVESRFGEAEVTVFRAGSWSVGSISRHGRGHHHLPHTVPYRANLASLEQLGARAVLATTTVGAVEPGIPLGRPILFDELFFPENRLPGGEPCTVFTEPGDPERGHSIMGEPFSPRLRRRMELAARGLGMEVVVGGVYGHTNGPRFETRAEIRALQAAGVTAVSQTCGPEAVLAGELEMPFCLVGFPVNYATGVAESEPKEELDRLLSLSARVLPRLVLRAVEMLEEEDFGFGHGYVYRMEGEWVDAKPVPGPAVYSGEPGLPAKCHVVEQPRTNLFSEPLEEHPMMNYPLRLLLGMILLLAVVFAPVACGGSEQGSSEQGSKDEGAAEEEYAASAAEPADAQPLDEEPAGEVIEVGNGPEGLVADPETGLVAVGLREPDELALVDGSTGEVVRTVGLPASPRHLGIAGPGGPVLVPSEGDWTLVQVSLPEGEVLSEVSVGAVPHDADAAPDGRIFVGNEFSDTLSVIEGDEYLETIDVPLQPGGVATTQDGLVGVIGVSALELEVFEADTLESLGRADAGDGPTHIRAGPDDRFYVTDTRGDALLIYETRPEPEQVERVPLPGQPYGIDVDRERGHLWITLTAENQLVQFALEGGTPRELARYPTVSEPNTVAVNPATGRVFVGGRANGELQILDPQ